ncbi:MAG: hypothetical protein LBT56_04215, partial [Prevotellaceae bacterium]|nr:hypothetical protein [Prevotellaceae bacterium]
SGVIKKGDSPLFIFLDGRMIGVGTVDKGILATVPNDNLSHTLTVWTSSSKIYSTTVNFAQKNEYIFMWDGKTIRL